MTKERKRGILLGDAVIQGKVVDGKVDSLVGVFNVAATTFKVVGRECWWKIRRR